MNPRLRAIRVTLCGALLAALPGCWSQPLATQVEPTASPMTRSPSSGEAGPAAAQPGQPTGVSVPSPAALAHISSAGFVPPTETRSELQNGLSIVVRADSASRGLLARTALLRIVLPAGRRDAATANVELAAMMLLAASEHGEPSLEAAIHDLGGRATVTVGVEDSAIDIAVPVEGAAHALLHLASALQREPRSEPQLDIVRLRLLREWRARCNSAPFETLVRRLLAEPTTTPTEFLARTQEATLEDIRGGWRLLSQPTGAALAITVPGGEKPEVVHAGAKLAFSAWSSLVRPRATRPPDLLPPVVWAQGNDVPRGAFVLLRPEIGDKLDVELLVLLECLSHKGLGGRLGKAFERLLGSGPPLTSEAVSVGSRTIALLHAATTPEQAVTWTGAMRSALESLVRERPDGDELVAAAGRVRLALVEQCADPKAWAAGATARTQERRKDDALARAITRLEDPLSLSLAAALPELPSHLLTLLVHGGTPPAESKVMLLEQPLPPSGSRRRSTPTRPNASRRRSRSSSSRSWRSAAATSSPASKATSGAATCPPATRWSRATRSGTAATRTCAASARSSRPRSSSRSRPQGLGGIGGPAGHPRRGGGRPAPAPRVAPSARARHGLAARQGSLQARLGRENRGPGDGHPRAHRSDPRTVARAGRRAVRPDQAGRDA
jgi:hypothetical protein